MQISWTECLWSHFYWTELSLSLSLSLCVSVSVCLYVCLCACVSCVCVCVRACVWVGGEGGHTQVRRDDGSKRHGHIE